MPREFSARADEHDGPGDHWVTVDGHHILIHESQGNAQRSGPQRAGQNQQTPQSLAAQIPAEVRVEMARAISDSNAPTLDDKKGGFHEEYGVAGLDASGKWVVSRDKPGPYASPDATEHVSPSYKAADPTKAYSIVDPRVVFHVHPGGETEKHRWVQPPSDVDKAAAIPGQINIVFGYRRRKRPPHAGECGEGKRENVAIRAARAHDLRGHLPLQTLGSKVRLRMQVRERGKRVSGPALTHKCGRQWHNSSDL